MIRPTSPFPCICQNKIFFFVDVIFHSADWCFVGIVEITPCLITVTMFFKKFSFASHPILMRWLAIDTWASFCSGDSIFGTMMFKASIVCRLSFWTIWQICCLLWGCLLCVCTDFTRSHTVVTFSLPHIRSLHFNSEESQNMPFMWWHFKNSTKKKLCKG